MAATTETTKIINVFNNSGLFSNHYLENMIQEVPEWDDDASLRETSSQIKLPSTQMSPEYILIKPLYVLPRLDHLRKSPVLPGLFHVLREFELILAA